MTRTTKRRPKKVDIDKPTGYIKRKLRRWVRVQSKRAIEQWK